VARSGVVVPRTPIPIPRTAAGNRQLVRDFGTCLNFDGATTFVTTPVNPATTGFNIAFWIKLSSVIPQQRIVSYSTAGPTGGFNIEKGNNLRSIGFSVYNGGSQQVLINTSDLVPNVWYHIVCTYTNNEAKMYLNSVLVGTDTSVTMTDPTQTCTIGRNAATSVLFTGGAMDQFILHNTATPWTQAQVNNLYFRGTIPTGATIIYNFTGNVDDSSGNGNNGTATGATYSTNVFIKPRTAA